MKKKDLFLKFGVLTASVLLTACASRDEIDISDTPLADGKIKAQFNISIPQSYKSAKTRTTDYVVQEGENGTLTDLAYFRGLQDIYLFPFVKTNVTDGDDVVKNLTSKGRIRLSQILKPTVATGNYINEIPSQKLLKGNNAVLFGDVDVTIGTNHFLFYGHAIDVTSDDGGNMFMNGSLIPYDMTDPDNPVAIDKTSYASITPSKLSFQLKGILADEENADDKETAILAFLNNILHASATVDGSTVTWANTSSLDLKILYNNFKSMRAGSSACIQAAIEMLYFKGLYSKKSDTNLGSEVTALATAICKVIEDNEDVALDPTNEKLTFDANSNLAGYPEVMPAGSAVLGIEKDGNGIESFTYVLPNTADSYFVNAAALNVPAKVRYVYPANLYYFGNSGILVSNDLKTDLYEANTSAGTSADLWASIANTTNFANGTHITSNTKSIAIKDQVQYAVGRLDTKVSTYKTSSGPTTLLDATEKTANAVSISDLKITGILIGGQRAVNWKFDSEGAAATDQYIIYDNIEKSCNIDGGIALTNSAFANIVNNSTATGFNHTLVLQTKKYTAGTPATGDEKVSVLIEFLNNGKAFEGKDGTIGKGCKFYLLGELDMSKLSGTDLKSDYIFQQDYITCANFTIASLKNAVNVIPDLRDPQIELGLSVDLSWKEGNTFNYEIP
jgi:hypothetical protein